MLAQEGDPGEFLAEPVVQVLTDAGGVGRGEEEWGQALSRREKPVVEGGVEEH
jgi:hypothetical protein